jgi:hypothetical protein
MPCRQHRQPEIINLQPRADGTAKPYQVRQVRNVLLSWDLGPEEQKGEDDDDEDER